MATSICLPCIGLGCDNPDDLAAGIDGAIYSTLDYSFIVQCPTGCQCEAGLFPRTISILASTIPPVIPPISEPGNQIVLRLQGCSALITRTLSTGSTQAEIAAAAQSMQAEWAGQQALCIAAALPGVNCTQNDSISVCNDAQIFSCAAPAGNVNVPAGTYCQQLVTTGLTQAQIDQQVAIIKANLNGNARNRDCSGIVCSLQVVYTGLPGSTDIGFDVTNNGTTPFDSTQLCIVLQGPGFGTFCGAAQVAPGGGHYAFDVSPAAPDQFKLTYNGITLFQQPGVIPSQTTVFLVVGCF